MSYTADMVERKKFYYSFRKIDGHDKDINICISARELGKSTSFWLDKAYYPFRKNGTPLLYLVRNVVEITEAFITSIQDNIINKFTDDNVTFQFNKGSFKDGIVDVRINDKIFFRILAMNIPLRRIKLALLKDINVIGMDEFIINPRRGEKYLKGEAFTIAEIYSTYKRERKDKSKHLKMYFMGNPYSLHNPLFQWLGINTKLLKLGCTLVGEDYVVQWEKLSDELKEYILNDNPLYKFDEEYKTYAFGGLPILDTNIKTTEMPQNYQLQFIFRYEGKYIGIYKNRYLEDLSDRYWVGFLTRVEISTKRNSYCFDFGELVSRCRLISKEDKDKFARFKSAMRRREVLFQNVDVYYSIEEIYFNL